MCIHVVLHAQTYQCRQLLHRILHQVTYRQTFARTKLSKLNHSTTGFFKDHNVSTPSELLFSFCSVFKRHLLRPFCMTPSEFWLLLVYVIFISFSFLFFCLMHDVLLLYGCSVACRRMWCLFSRTCAFFMQDTSHSKLWNFIKMQFM
jgi:hypothetical protein